MDTLPGRIYANAVAGGDGIALYWDDSVVSYRSLAQKAKMAARGLTASSVRRGDRVAVGLPNSPELILASLAVLSAGAVLVPLNPSYTADEAAYVVGDAGARVVLTHADQARALQGARLGTVEQILTDIPVGEADIECEWPVPEDPALIVYTSGTTGKPKGAVLSHRAVVTNLDTVANAWRWTPADRLLLTLPCFHLHGLALGILGSLLVGSSIVLRRRFVAEDVPADIARYRITLFFGVPTMYNRLVALPGEALQGHDLSSMRLWVCGSAPLTAATFVRFRQGFGHEILERFGMSEGGFMIAAPYEGPRRPGIVGCPLPGIEIRVVDFDAADGGTLRDVGDGEVGELVIRGPNLFSGYWNRPAETARTFVGGFFRSGDLALREPDGMIRITGRRSLDIIKTRGFKVSAVEIENQLQLHPAVKEVAVVGMPDADQGERVVAVVTPAASVRSTSDELRSFVAEHLAPHKVPAEVIFLDEIPRTGPGKFSKKALIARLNRQSVLGDP
jgi:malonyl-CoA/methylmalonyl-CoA synthetase